MTERSTDQDGVDAPRSGLGVQLRAARVERGLAVDDVANALHLATRSVEALEAEDWAALPPEPFSSGYVRAYAALLELDSRPLLQLMPKNQSPGEDETLRVAAPVHTAPQMPRRVAVGGVMMVVLAIVAGAGWWALDRGTPIPGLEPLEEMIASVTGADGEAEPEIEPDQGMESPAGDESPDESAMDEASPPGLDEPDAADEGLEDDDPLVDSDEPLLENDTVDPVTADDGLDLDMVDLEALAQRAQEDDSGPAPDDDAGEMAEDPLFDGDEHFDLAPGGDAEPRSDDLVEPELSGPEVDVAGDDMAQTGDENGNGVADDDAVADPDDLAELVMEFLGPSWVEVTDARGERLMYGLVQEEGEHRLEGEAPFSVVVGDVTQVSVFFEGEEIDLGSEDPGSVARLEVP